MVNKLYRIFTGLTLAKDLMRMEVSFPVEVLTAKETLHGLVAKADSRERKQIGKALQRIGHASDDSFIFS